jgi:hypothetical protein
MEVGLAHRVLGAREGRVHGEGARQSETGLGKHWPYMRRRMKVSTQLVQIAKKAKLDRKVRFTSLAHVLTPEFLKETWGTINRQGASGVDGESIEQFDLTLLTWAMRKFKRFVDHTIRASQFLQKLARDHANLFVHWRLGMTGTFA